ncbi:hypothetical protein SAMN04515665_12415 [Blastococcus sp. DSM 46786]|uniref:DUF2470 domain-containing protein n=1 Tax=Blastococcus sp. DSM 46786 TaxID=1798227 RepID=UPI0008B60BDB|nr:DUF2470 domain-containing protein [Blastococcus sp. DSM 46786]SEL94902.1 hypothetical protein SAMN04515665_12415 [Blastococcus sp. DSM 46786]
MTAGPTHSSAAVDRQPPAAERARTVAVCCAATLHVAGTGSCSVLAATTTADGDVLLVVPTGGGVMTALRGSPLGDVPARLTVADRAPFPLRHPVRGLVQLTGWLVPVEEPDVPQLVLDFADSSPADVLFEVGLGAALVRLDLAEVELEESGTRAEVDPDDFRAARPDAVSAAETELVSAHRVPLGRLCTRVQHWAGRHDDVRLLGLDRFGVRFRVQGRDGCYDLRVPFAEALDGVDGFATAVDHLVSCGPA